MKRRRIITLVALLVIGVIVYFTMAGFSVDIYTFNPLPQQVSLGLDLTGGVYAVFNADQGEYTDAEFDAKMYTTLSVLRNRLDEKVHRGYRCAAGHRPDRVVGLKRDVPDKRP
jgi:preprotein translocase subunit SecD